MPDPVLMLTAMAIAFVVSAVLLGMIGWQTRQLASSAFDVGWILGMAAGFVLGCWALGSRPHWPPRDDQERLFALILPAIAVVELLAAFPRVPRWLIWPLRLMIVAGGARVLLHRTTYITDLTGPGTSEWSPSLAGLIFAGLAALEAAVWVLLSSARSPGTGTLAAGLRGGHDRGYRSDGDAFRLCHRRPGRAAARGGPHGCHERRTRAESQIAANGPARCGDRWAFQPARDRPLLRRAHLGSRGRVVLRPLLGWLLELPYARRLPPWARGLARVILVGAVVLAVIIGAQRKFSHDFAPPGEAGPKEPSVQDYMDFGK